MMLGDRAGIWVRAQLGQFKWKHQGETFDFWAMGLISTDTTSLLQARTHFWAPPAPSLRTQLLAVPRMGSPMSPLGEGLSTPPPCTSLSPLQRLEKLAAGVEEVLEALGHRVLPALGLVLAGLWGAESRGCWSRR